MASFSLSCGRIPFLVAVVLALSTHVGGALAPISRTLGKQASSVTLVANSSVDSPLIDAVLGKRAPDLGLPLRGQLAAAIAEESASAGYDPLLVLSVIAVESEFDDDAVSPKGARGLMQIKPSTLLALAEHESLRLTTEEIAADPALRIRLGIRYLRSLQDRFGSLDLALMAYNAGPARLTRAIQEGEVDAFRRYARLVKRTFRMFREGEGLEGGWALAQRDSAREGGP